MADAKTPTRGSGVRFGNVDRALIMRRSARLFREHGFHATTMQDIADSVGILKGSLYHHIRSKEELLVETLLASVTDMLHEVEVVVEAPEPPRSKLRLALRAELVAMARHQDEILVWLTERSRTDVPLQDVERLARSVDATLRKILQEGAEQGEWADANLDLAYQAIRGMVVQFPVWYRPNGKLPLATIADRFADYAEAILDIAAPPAC